MFTHLKNMFITFLKIVYTMKKCSCNVFKKFIAFAKMFATFKKNVHNFQKYTLGI